MKHLNNPHKLAAKHSFLYNSRINHLVTRRKLYNAILGSPSVLAVHAAKSIKSMPKAWYLEKKAPSRMVLACSGFIDECSKRMSILNNIDIIQTGTEGQPKRDLSNSLHEQKKNIPSCWHYLQLCRLSQLVHQGNDSNVTSGSRCIRM